MIYKSNYKMEKNYPSEQSTHFQLLNKKLSRNLSVKTSTLDSYNQPTPPIETGVPVLFVKKKNSSLCLYVNFCRLNQRIDICFH